jgi:molybdopterin molybdotransferase
MDGWALCADATPGVFTVVGESAAGRPHHRRLVQGEAVRISTGAVVPQGADTVLRREDGIERDGVLSAPWVGPGHDIRLAGQDYPLAAAVLDAGHLVHTHDVAVIAACGWDGAFCDRRARVAVVSIGDELVPVGRVPGEGEVVDSNRLAIAAAVEAAGAEVASTRWVPDDRHALEELITDAVQPGPGVVDLLITTGGASVGDHDHVRPVLRSLGAEMALEGIAMRPGRPTALGVIGTCRVLVLPGTPSATVVAFHVIGRELLGAAAWTPGILTTEYRSRRDVDEFVRCRHTPLGLVPLTAQGPGSLAGLAGADALAWIPWGRSHVASGSSVATTGMP